MKGLCLLLLTFFSLQLCAQTQARYDEGTVVKDTTGFVYPYAIWSPLVQKGSHVLKPENPSDRNTAYFIERRSDADKEEQEKKKETKLAKLPKPSESDYFKTGQPAVLYNLVDILGNKINLQEARGKVIVMNFWFVNCPPCREEIPELNNLVDKFRGNDKVVFVAIALDKKPQLEGFLGTRPFKYAIVEDGRMLAGTYGVELYPTHAVIDQEGKVYFHTSGLAENTVYWIKKSITELLAKEQKTAAR